MMTATLDAVASKKKDKPEPTPEERAAEELVRHAREQGLSLTGPDGLLKQLTKMVLETALDQEMTEHLGHEKNGPVLNETGNIRNCTRAKTVLTESTGEVGIEVPRDRDGTFEPRIIKKRQRRLSGVDEIVLSLYAKGLTTGEISAHGPMEARPSLARVGCGYRRLQCRERHRGYFSSRTAWPLSLCNSAITPRNLPVVKSNAMTWS
jgi:putative transposase